MKLKLAREIAARTKPRFIEIPRERGGGKVPFTEEQLTVMRGGLTAEEYRWKLIREVLERVTGRRPKPTPQPAYYPVFRS